VRASEIYTVRYGSNDATGAEGPTARDTWTVRSTLARDLTGHVNRDAHTISGKSKGFSEKSR
jgi:hypothetical protein